MFYPKNPKRPNGQSANMAHFVAFFISFQKIIPSKIPPGGGGGTGVIGGSRTKMKFLWRFCVVTLLFGIFCWCRGFCLFSKTFCPLRFATPSKQLQSTTILLERILVSQHSL